MWLKWLLKLLNLSVEDELPKPRISELVISSDVVRSEIEGMQLRLMYPTLLDEFQLYYYTTLMNWGKVIDYIYKAFKFPDYVPARKDCDFFGILFYALVQAYFGLNGSAFIIGASPEGSHGYNMLRTEHGYYIWEPNPAFKLKKPFKLEGQYDYAPKYVLI